MHYADHLGKIEYDNISPGTSLDGNIAVFEDIFLNDDIVKYRRMGSAGLSCCAIFIDGMVNSDIINHYILLPLGGFTGKSLTRDMVERLLPANEVKPTRKFSEAVSAVLSGDTALLLDGSDEILTFGTKGFSVRSTDEPDNEKVLYGPREGFVESVMQNASMLRRRLQTSDLKFQLVPVGSRTNTKAFICYLDSLVNRDVLQELQQRLEKLSVDGLLDSNAITERIADRPYSLFSTIGKTERPDTVASKLLDGGVAIMLDGTPVSLIVPYLFIENFKSADDYYLRFYYASVSRALRYLAFFISISAGALYTAAVTFHTEILPAATMLTVSAAKSGTPFPTWLEFTGLMVLFEMLRETGIRMSSKIGHALSIVGALVVGQAAVEAKIISAPIVIIVAVSAIAGLMVPRLSAASMVIRLFAVIAASMTGFYGYIFVMLGMCVHLFSLDSFGFQYTGHLLPSGSRDITDTVVRAPMRFLKWRTKFIAHDEKRSGGM